MATLRKRMGDSFGCFVKYRLALSMLLAVSVLAAEMEPICWAQAAPASAANPAYVASMTFDVASVRENKVDPSAGIFISGGFGAQSSTFRVVNWDLSMLLSNAYGVDRSQVVGAPEWPWPTLFTIEAKVDSDAAAKMAKLSDREKRLEEQHMLQALLAERFALKAHWASRVGDVYDLVAAKDGPKLGASGSMELSSEERKDFAGETVPTIYQKNDGGGYDFIAHGATMSELAETLTGQFSQPVADRTGLSGKYDFVLRYKGRWERDREADDMEALPPLDQALQRQLGLKVQKAKGAISYLAIDHVEKPSAN